MALKRFIHDKLKNVANRWQYHCYFFIDGTKETFDFLIGQHALAPVVATSQVAACYGETKGMLSAQQAVA